MTSFGWTLWIDTKVSILLLLVRGTIFTTHNYKKLEHECRMFLYRYIY
jgi:hypothetical protein